MALAYAVKDGRLAVNPAAGVSLPRVQQAERRFLTYRQVHELAEECGGLTGCFSWRIRVSVG